MWDALAMRASASLSKQAGFFLVSWYDSGRCFLRAKDEACKLETVHLALVSSSEVA